MNRYPVWKYAILVIALLVGALYTLPNFFGEAPAVQVSSAKATLKVDAAVQRRVEEALKAAGVVPDAVSFDGNSVRARFDSPDSQLKAKDAIQKALVPDPADPPYIVALNLVSRSPTGSARCMRAPCTWGWTCAAACTSCCRWTCRRPSPRRPNRSPATCAPRCATRTSATAASAATARRWTSACATRRPPRPRAT